MVGRELVEASCDTPIDADDGPALETGPIISYPPGILTTLISIAEK
jgi:hypothetical protein